MKRYGITIPFPGVPLHQQRDWLIELADLGFTDFWTSETHELDGLTPLVLASCWVPTARVGTAILPAYTRGPALMAMSAAALAEAAPGRAVFGIGSSSNVIVEGWNGVPFEQPYQRTRDVLRFVKAALTGEKVTDVYETLNVKGFRLGRVPDPAPKLMVAGLRKGMLGLAGRESEGAIINWLSADDVKTVTPYVHAGGPDREIIDRIMVFPSEDKDAVRYVGRMAITAYLNVPVYAAFHEWLGRGERLQGMWDAWKAGDRKRALEEVPDSVIDELIVHGSPEECREKIARFVDAGVTTPVLAVLPTGEDLREVTRRLAPSA